MSDEALKVLCFALEDRLFAADIRGLREILRSVPVTEIPGAPEHIAGVINLRGRLLPLIDLRRVLLGSRSVLAREERRVLVARASGIDAGLLVDRVLEVVTVDPASLAPVPGGALAGNEWVVAAFRHGPEDEESRVCLLLRLGAVLRQGAASAMGGPP